MKKPLKRPRLKSVKEPLRLDGTLMRSDAVSGEPRSRRANINNVRKQILEIRRVVWIEQEALAELQKSGMRLGVREQASPSAPAQRATTRALSAASRAFALIEVIVPKRIASEEIGDALEVIERLLIEGRPVWQIYVKLIATVFWVLAHAARDVVKGPAGQKTPARKR